LPPPPHPRTVTAGYRTTRRADEKCREASEAALFSFDALSRLRLHRATS
jgi:hypothetical protein